MIEFNINYVKEMNFTSVVFDHEDNAHDKADEMQFYPETFLEVQF